MSDNKIEKFENPVRISELDPRTTLMRAGFKDGMKLCDIGAGTGIFSFPAAEISNDDVYALEISDKMIEILSTRIVERKVKNLKVVKVDSHILPVENNLFDMVIMVTVFHEVEDREFMINEVKRILKTNGKLMIVEFYKRETPMGPPVDHRISEENVEEICNTHGLRTISKFSLGNNFYTIVFEL